MANVASLDRKWPLAALSVVLVLLLAFFPVFFMGKTLMHASSDVPSVMNYGAFPQVAKPGIWTQRTGDPGAPAWQNEPWFALISEQYWREFNLPLWNPYNAYGTPLAASMQPQPYFPLAILLSLHTSVATYDLFIVGRLFVAAMAMFAFARMFLTSLPSLFAAFVFALSGYFIVYLNMPHISVEVLMPVVLLALEWLLRSRSWSAVAAVAVVVLLGMVGGMPESLFLMLAFGSLYYVCRIVFEPTFRAHALGHMGRFVSAISLGFGLSAFLLFPFIELLGVSHDVHQVSNIGGHKTGLNFDNDARTVIRYVLPLIFGPITSSTLSGAPPVSELRGYWGIIPLVFMLVAFAALFTAKRDPHTNTRRLLTLFFATTLVVMVMKRFGSLLINWIGHLPVFEMVDLAKYQGSLVALCAAMLSAVGFAALIERRVTSRGLLVCLGVTLVVVVSPMILFRSGIQPGARFALVFFYGSVLCGVLWTVVVGGIVLYAQRADELKRNRLLRGIVACVALELMFSYIVPVFHVMNRLAPATASPYAGAPYIDFIKAKNTDQSRVFARENFLFPNWSAAFGLEDVRNLDALKYIRFHNFVRGFLLKPGEEGRMSGELGDRFTGQDEIYAFNTDVERRFLALSSIKYLISGSDYLDAPVVLGEILEQQKGKTIAGFGRDVFRVESTPPRSALGFMQHPPSSRLAYRTRIDARTPVFEVLVAIKGEVARRGDGVGFRLEVKDGDTIRALAEVNLNPRDVPADRAGRVIRADLSQFAGREIELLFSTDPGPAGDSSWDWGGWASLRFLPLSGEFPQDPGAFKRVYDDEVRVFEVPGVLPRASIYTSIELVPDDDVLARLKNPAFDLHKRAVVSRETTRGADEKAIADLAQSPATPVAAANITTYQSQRVRIEANAIAPSLLVLNDANYPGWGAYVNGKEVPIVWANYLFRGVPIPSGKSVVEFRYEPLSFRLGAIVALLSLVILAGLVIYGRGKHRTTTTVRA